MSVEREHEAIELLREIIGPLDMPDQWGYRAADAVTNDFLRGRIVALLAGAQQRDETAALRAALGQASAAMEAAEFGAEDYSGSLSQITLSVCPVCGGATPESEVEVLRAYYEDCGEDVDDDAEADNDDDAFVASHTGHMDHCALAKAIQVAREVLGLPPQRWATPAERRDAQRGHDAAACERAKYPDGIDKGRPE